MKVIGHPEWVSDPRFARYADRRENWGSLMDGVEAWSRSATTAKCLAALNGENVPSSAYRTVAERVLVEPERQVAEVVPAVTRTVERTVVVEPAHEVTETIRRNTT